VKEGQERGSGLAEVLRFEKNSIKHEISASMSEGKGHGNANSEISGICGGVVQRF
jgi:hypothetical protein